MLRKLTFFIFSVMLVFSAVAQITTSSLSGLVVDENSSPMIGATVAAVHTPSGTEYYTSSNIDGRFQISGMRPGGPYTITVKYVGYQDNVVDNINLQLGNTFNIDVPMSISSTSLGEVVVTGIHSKFQSEKTGAVTNINNQQIKNLPTVTRSITDVTKLSPFAGNGMSIAGTDGRTANFTVDGANFNNNFGLNDALPGGGNPISLEAIEEMQVVVAPYDVRQTNFIGGGVNAITKSGTNKFKGSAYIFHRNENMRGDAVDRQQISKARDKFAETTYGATIGGPIIKDKLFFFVNGEMTQQPTVVNMWRASEDGVAVPDRYISRTTLADLQKVSDFVKNKYGYDTGSFTNFPADENNYKLLARLDWNINRDNHLAVRYNYTKNRYWSNPNSSSMDGATRMPTARVSQKSFSFANSMYGMDNLVHSLSFDLNSRLTDNLSNQFLATWSKLDDIRASNSSEFPFIDITKTDDEGNRDNYMALGYELFTWNNAVHNKIWNIKDDLTWTYGNHKVIGGLSFEHQMADNSYMRNGTGYYRYNSVDDFINGAAPEVVCLTYGYGGNNAPAARVQFNKFGIYGQDDWNITRNFKLNYGIRLDGLFFNNKDLMTNNAILALNYPGDRHIDTGKWPNNHLIVQPRLGFNWDMFGNKVLIMRGGSGLFSGRLPLVFFTNMPTNSGMIQYQAQLSARNGIDMNQFAGGLVVDNEGRATVDALKNKLISMGYPENVNPDMGTVPSSISAVDPTFRMPMIWKSSLAFDWQVPVKFPFTVTVEGIYNKNVNAATISDWSIPSVDGFDRFVGVDNRPIYPKNFRQGTKAFVLGNTSRGYGWIGNVTLNAQPTDWLNLMAAYTHTVNKEVTGMPGSAAESAFTYVPTTDGPNNIKLHNSQYVIPDRFVLSAIGNDKSGNHYGLIYETFRGGNNYSYMMSNDMNGDGYNYDALYIPTDEQVNSNQFRFVSEGDKTRFMDYVHANNYLNKNQGKVAEGYSVYSPWVHRVDLSYKHDFSFNVSGAKHTLQLLFDVKNVLNLFNSNWGVAKYLNPEIGSDARILKYEGRDNDGYALFSTPKVIDGNTKTFVPNKAIGQCWNASIGIKYIFN